MFKKIFVNVIIIIMILSANVYATKTTVSSSSSKNSKQTNTINNTNIKTSEAKLKELKVTDYKLFPEFKSNIYTYNLDLKEDVNKIEVIAEPEAGNAKVEILGNENLQSGENTVKINVTTSDGTNTKTYKINTYINAENVEIQKESKQPAIILIAILGTSIIILGTFMAIKRRK